MNQTTVPTTNDVVDRVAQRAHGAVDRVAAAAAPAVEKLLSSAAAASDTVRSTAANAADTVRSSAASAAEIARAKADQLGALEEQWVASGRGFVREHPLAIVGASLLIGILIGHIGASRRYGP